MLQRLIEILYELDYVDVDPNIALRDYVSSLDIIELICTIEEIYSISIPEDDTHYFGDSLVNIENYLTQQVYKNETKKN